MTPRKGKSVGHIFMNMAFAVSYVSNEDDRENVRKLISQHGGKVLEDGFDGLFDPVASPNKSRSSTDEEQTQLSLSENATTLTFVALIADDFSRKAKYMQALALGLPCISGQWITACVETQAIVEWEAYLLVAGQSSFLKNAHISRRLLPYSAADASLPSTFDGRRKLLQGKSILLVTGKGRAVEKRKAYVFLTRALGPDRVGQATDLINAKDKLLKAEESGEPYDWLYVEGNHSAAEEAVFSSGPITVGGSKKRKRGPIPAEDTAAPAPKRIRVINDEFVIQSLILGQLIED